MKLQRLYSLVRQAVDDYQMIGEGDRIAVGISGGKDSLTLLYALNGLRRFYPVKFDLCAITVDLGFGDFDLSPVRTLCEQFLIPYTVISTEIGKILFEIRRETNPCSLCAKLRKGALNKAALDLGCGKIAYAHHKDDVVETMLLSMIYEGRFNTFAPKTYLDRTGLTLIRPMIYVNEADVIGFSRKYGLPVCKNPCPADGFTKREYVKNLTKQIRQTAPEARDHMFHAITQSSIDGWEAAGSQKEDPPDRVPESRI